MPATYPLFAEKLTNLPILRVTAKLPRDDDATAASFAVQNNAVCFQDEPLLPLTPYGLTGVACEAVRDQGVEGDNDTASEMSVWSIKVMLEPQLQSQGVAVPDCQPWWPAKDLVLREWTHLACRHCQHALVRNDKPFACKDMPSEHWYELVECWICHEAKPEEHQSRLKPILARPATLLVGSYYFFLDAADLLNDAVVIDNELAKQINWDRGTLTKWIAVNCYHCGKVMGTGQFERRDDNERMMAVKLFKYCVDILPENTQRARPEFMHMLVGDMMEAARAHATRRFLIQGQKSDKIYALVWLFNWDTTVIYNHGFADNDDDNDVADATLRVRHGLKILYADGQTMGTQWAQDTATDHLIYPDAYCQQLWHQLQASTRLLPPSLRTLQHPALSRTKDFAVAVLPR
ncbi:HECT-like ubiquitin-conjugating enzyme-binding-domain-containing protein [Gongronella butleri]|nr:HECT-like ubiquitin-conjugating enzyme-binding-domain-containing protein [Gongronella butleri]